MNDPHGAGDPHDRDPERIPTQAELDAEDLAELERSSRDHDQSALYPPRPADPGRPPVALALHARVVWWGAAVIGLILAVYGFFSLGTITDDLRQRLLEGVVTDPANSAPEDQVETLAGFFPPFMLVMIVVVLVIEYLLLMAAVTHHSRHCRNFFLAAVVVHLLCIPVGVDLLFRYPDISSTMVVLSWVQFALLVIAALLTVRRSVNTWLPESTRMRPTRMMRGR
ncbi:hypothetical protein RVF83_07895 [Gordonia rubripertincta]|uniref:DUF2127 domain-containing protein n=2 Tax=Gordonia rubripertincta TaxID=36822 RepID=A0AAW6R929_GORRU|nr:hypothetical protein [Gordonia rubripertincta]MDG6780895.1 hypothetical protein [Gordonia rubripertincta]NKY63332.1 hypothetical protein [Gordonia rubripertincta]GAB83726.1 hypothetical protein GORBP_014_00210 [Gordonia rubripertincta NBRC 101908]